MRIFKSLFCVLSILALSPVGNILGQNPWSMTLEEVVNMGMPVINVTTIEDRFPTYDQIYPPEGCIGTTIANKEKLPGRIQRIEPDGTVSYDSGPYVDSESGMTIRIRGNGSALRPKKPFKVKLQKKADLLNRKDPDKEDKNWILMMDRDRKNITGHMVNQWLDMVWTPSWEFVNLVYNGKYHGLYLLVESTERNPKCRLDVSPTGFIVEHDAYWWKAPEESFPSSLTGPRYAYTFKWPDYDELENYRINYIEDTIRAYEEATTQDNYSDLIDVNSLARWVLGHDILGTLDTGGANRYICKYDDTAGSKLFMGNMWDFDTSENLTDQLTIFHTYFFKEMFNNKKNQALLRAYVEMWDYYGERIFDSLDKLFSKQISEGDELYDKNAALDHSRWGWDVQTDYKFTAERQKNYDSNRRKHMKEAVSNLRKDISAIVEIEDSEAIVNVEGMHLEVSGVSGEVHLYRLDGTLVASGISSLDITVPQNGMYILTFEGVSKKLMF